jgi:iron complex transport system substrate-binding protein
VFFARKNQDRNYPGLVQGFFVGLFSQSVRQGIFVALSSSNVVPRASLVAAGLLLLCAAGSAAQAASPGTPAVPVTREITDEVGRTVRVPATPSRIVSLAPSLTETLYALGVDNRLVGDTDYCDYPPDAKKKPKVGGAINPNLEAIAALHPDLVLVTKGFNRLDTVRALDTLGIPSYATDPHTVDQIISSTEKLATVLNIEAAGKALADDLQRHLAALQAKLGPLTPKRVLFVVWTDPLISVGKNTFIADALRIAGAASVVESAQDWPQVSLEEIVHLQPDYLVFATSHSDGAAHDFELIADRPGWRILDAVRNRHFAVISDAVNRPAPRIVSAIEDLARQLHPEAFPDTPGSQKMSPPANAPEPQNRSAKTVSERFVAATYYTESTCTR